MSMKPAKHDNAHAARFVSDVSDRGGGGWHDPEDNESWDGEDRHYIPGPRGPEAVIDDDYERKHQVPSDESDEDNVSRNLVEIIDLICVSHQIMLTHRDFSSSGYTVGIATHQFALIGKHAQL
jgi:hypothetical protein